MDCRLFRLLVQKYYDGELSDAEASEYEEHRRQCGDCRRIDAEYARLFSILDGMPEYEPSEGFNHAVLSRVDLSKYREGVLAKGARGAARLFGPIPSTIRNIVTVMASLLVIALIYHPMLDLLINLISNGIILLNNSVESAGGMLHKIGVPLVSMLSAKSYGVVATTILRSLRIVIEALPVQYMGLTLLTAFVVTLVIVLMGKEIRRKGETNVNLY